MEGVLAERPSVDTVSGIYRSRKAGSSSDRFFAAIIFANRALSKANADPAREESQHHGSCGCMPKILAACTVIKFTPDLIDRRDASL
jgi:hypothetical protein